VPHSVASASAPDVERILPEGTRRPDDIPREIFDAALAIHLAGRRLDMRALAAELGMGRATLYRKVGGREQLLGAVLWYLTRRVIAAAVIETVGRRGHDRVVAVVRFFLEGIHGAEPLTSLLRREPEAALRLLTSNRGPVHGGIVAALERLLAEEEERGELRLSIDRPTLAYAIVRVAESFLYADVIAKAVSDVDRAVEVATRLLAGSELRQV
jgi:AcrR family transcriptional regulator